MAELDKLEAKSSPAGVYGEFKNRAELWENEPLPVTRADNLNQGDDVWGLRSDYTKISEYP